jgi:hypothetical protein
MDVVVIYLKALAFTGALREIAKVLRLFHGIYLSN